jgi:hypothetical protein
VCAASGPESPAAGTRHGLPHAIIAWLALQPLSIRLRARMAGLEGKLALALRLTFTTVYGGIGHRARDGTLLVDWGCV